jgi:hypothetical protein
MTLWSDQIAIGYSRFVPLRVIHFQITEDSFRCTHDSGFPSADVGNADEAPPTERQLYGTSMVKIFLLPGS